MKLGLTAIALAALLSSSLAAVAQQQQPPVPDAPTPQAPKPLSSDVNGPITPGKGTGETPSGPNSSSNPTAQQPAPGNQAPSSQPPPTQGKDQVQTTPPVLPAAGEGFDKVTKLGTINVNFVEVPVTVKDSKGKLDTIPVKDPSRLVGVKVGDLVELTYTEAIAFTVEKGPTK